MILVVDNYDSFTYNLVQLLGALKAQVRVVRNDELRLSQIWDLSPTGIVISPGPGRPENAGISVSLVLEMASKIPVLGVCLGHQAIGKAFGCRIAPAPKLMHGKTSQILHSGCDIFRDLENPFKATRYHSLVVERRSLPAELEVTAETEDHIVMGIRHRHYPVYGVQFHPESILTMSGTLILKNFLDIVRES